MKKSLGAKTILYPMPVLVVGTYDANGKPNIMTAAWGGICCSQPPCVAISLRKATYTYEAMMARQAFTISIPPADYVKEADYVGIASGRKVDKFAVTGLTPVPSQVVDAPYVQEFPVVLECKIIHTLEIGLHTQFVGEILDVKAEAELLTPEGIPDLQKIKPFVFAFDSSAYYGIGDYLAPAFAIGKELRT